MSQQQVANTVQSMGNLLAYDIREGTNLEVEFEDWRGVEMTVIDVNGSVIEKGDTVEVICSIEDEGVPDDEFIGLYARCLSVGEMSVNYDVYGVLMGDEEDEEVIPTEIRRSNG